MFVDSKKEMLGEIELLTNAFQNSKTPYTIEEGIAAVIAESQMPNCIMIRQGNTIFIIHYVPKQKNQGMFRALNADTPQNYLQNSKTYYLVYLLLLIVHLTGQIQ